MDGGDIIPELVVPLVRSDRSGVPLQNASTFEASPGGVPFTPPAPATDRIEASYVEHRSILLWLACRKFRVPESDAEALLQEVFLSYLQSADGVTDARAWLVAAVCNASRHYWRVRGRVEPLPVGFGGQRDSDQNPDRVALEMTIQKVLGYLQPRCRETLHLHYFEGRTARDIGTLFDTTTRYAEKLIHKCLGRAREIYELIGKVRG